MSADIRWASSKMDAVMFVYDDGKTVITPVEALRPDQLDAINVFEAVHGEIRAAATKTPPVESLAISSEGAALGRVIAEWCGKTEAEFTAAYSQAVGGAGGAKQ
jgi:hypothetical protein